MVYNQVAFKNANENHTSVFLAATNESCFISCSSGSRCILAIYNAASCGFTELHPCLQLQSAERHKNLHECNSTTDVRIKKKVS